MDKRTKILNIRTNELIISDKINKFETIEYKYKLSNNEKRFLLLLLDNDLHTYSEFINFVPINSADSAKKTLRNILKKHEINVKNYSSKGYKLLDEILLDY